MEFRHSWLGWVWAAGSLALALGLFGVGGADHDTVSGLGALTALAACGAELLLRLRDRRARRDPVG